MVRNWWRREATFKKKAKTDAKTGSGLGFAAVLQASHSWSRGSLDDDDDSASMDNVAACLEALIVEVESNATLTAMGMPFTPMTLPLGSQRNMTVEEVDSGRSPDITSLEITEGGNWVSRADLELADPSVLQTGVVLGVASKVDEMVVELGDTEAPPVEDEPPRAGRYGKLQREGPGAEGAAGSTKKLASWSESGGIREGAFKKKSSGSMSSQGSAEFA